MTTETDHYKRALIGFAALTREYGPGWWEKIDLAALNLANPDQCPIGQLSEGKYNETLHDMHGLEPNGTCVGHDVASCNRWAVSHGFDVMPYNEAQYEALTVAWRELIETAKVAHHD